MFASIQVDSRKGAHPVLGYRLPDDDSICIEFSYKRTNANEYVYECKPCIVVKKTNNGGKVFTVKVEKTGERAFKSDPAKSATENRHICDFRNDPKCKFVKVAAQRLVFETIKKVKVQPATANSPFRIFTETTMTAVNDDRYGDYAEDVAKEYHGKGSEQRRVALSRAKNAGKLQDVHFDDIPDDQKLTQFGNNFVIHENSGALVLASERTGKAAVNAGIQCFLGDGNAKYSPSEFDQAGQIYTVHAVFESGDCEPIMFALMKKKTTPYYSTVFRAFRTFLETCGFDFDAALASGTQMILDFEHSAHNAWKEVFPEIKVSGCAFHFCQAVNRKIIHFGLQKFVEEEKNAGGEAPVTRWLSRLRASLFLNQALFDASEVLISDVSDDHPAAKAISDFQDYFKDTWLKMFKTVWLQYGKDRNRTTNQAEAYHRMMRSWFREGMRPQLSAVLNFCRGIDQNATFRCELLAEGLPTGRTERTQDVERREAISELIRDFTDGVKKAQEETEDLPSADFIIAFLDTISGFLPTSPV